MKCKIGTYPNLTKFLEVPLFPYRIFVENDVCSSNKDPEYANDPKYANTIKVKIDMFCAIDV